MLTRRKKKELEDAPPISSTRSSKPKPKSKTRQSISVCEKSEKVKRTTRKCNMEKPDAPKRVTRTKASKQTPIKKNKTPNKSTAASNGSENDLKISKSKENSLGPPGASRENSIPKTDREVSPVVSRKKTPKAWKTMTKSAARRSGRIYMQKTKDVYDIDLTLSPCKETAQKLRRKPRRKNFKGKKALPKRLKATVLTTDPMFKNPCSFSKPPIDTETWENESIYSDHMDNEDYDASASAIQEAGSTYGIPLAPLPRKVQQVNGSDIETPMPLNRFVGPTSTPRVEAFQLGDSESPLEEIPGDFDFISSNNESSHEEQHCPSRFEIPAIPKRVLAPKSNFQNNQPKVIPKPKSKSTDLNDSKIFDDVSLNSPIKKPPETFSKRQKIVKTLQQVDPDTSLSQAQIKHVYSPKYKPVKRIKKTKSSKAAPLKERNTKLPNKKKKPRTSKENEHHIPPKVQKVLDDWASDINSHFSEIDDTLLIVE